MVILVIPLRLLHTLVHGKEMMERYSYASIVMLVLNVTVGCQCAIGAVPLSPYPVEGKKRMVRCYDSKQHQT
jgi:hypothetical protein